MQLTRIAAGIVPAAALLVSLFLTGCSGPNAQIARCQTEKQELLAVIEQEKNRSQALQERSLALESRLDQSEKQLAQLVRPGSRLGEDGPSRMASSKPPRPLDPPVREPQASEKTDSSRSTVRELKLQAPSVGQESRLAALAERDTRLQYDPQLGTARLDIDVPFPNASAELTAEGRRKLDEVAAWLKSTETSDLRVLVSGHSSGMQKPPAGSAAGPRFDNDRQLAAARAMAVADYLDRHGIKEDRLAVIGSGGKGSPSRPGAVEILLSEPQTPVAGLEPAGNLRR